LDCDGEGKQYHLLHVIPVYLLGLVILNGTYYVHSLLEGISSVGQSLVYSYS